MISYQPFWETMRTRKMSAYTLRYQYGIGGGTLQRLKANQPVSTKTLDMLCKILDCSLDGVAVYVEDQDE